MMSALNVVGIPNLGLLECHAYGMPRALPYLASSIAIRFVLARW